MTDRPCPPNIAPEIWAELCAAKEAVKTKKDKAAFGNGKTSVGGEDSQRHGEAGLNGAAELRNLQDNEISRLAKLRIGDYERERNVSAERLGFRTSILDKLVAAERPADESTPGQGRKLELPDPEPWPEPVNGATLISELRDTVRRYVVCQDSAALVVALWITATWFEPVAQVAPILNLRSPIQRCGKTTLLGLIARLAKKSLAASGISPPAMFRTIEACCPTLLIDEADSFFTANEELRGLINSGHTRDSAFVIRTVGDDHEPRQFSTWGFKAVSGIGNRPGTIEDRSITIALQRKLPTEKTSRLRHAKPGLFEELRRKLCRCALDNMEGIGVARPSLPEALNDRDQDNWELLLAIADLCGGDWPSIARNAAVSLSGAKDDTAPLGGQLLDDVQEIVNTSAQEHGVYSQVLLDRLLGMTERPWGESNRGKPLTLNRLAKMLGAFGLKTKSLRMDGVVQRGYGIAELQAAFARYCTPNTVLAPKSPYQSATVLIARNQRLRSKSKCYKRGRCSTSKST